MLKRSTGKVPKNEEFLIIDTDQASANACTEIEERRKIILSRPDTILMKNVNQWLPDPYLSAAGAGCGQHRIYGRAMYNVHRERIFSAIGAAASELRNRTGGKDFFIIMVCAFGGGTGSSMVLDVAIDVRDWISKQFGSEPVIFGIGILPSSKESALPTANALGTLKELHFLMSHSEEIIMVEDEIPVVREKLVEIEARISEIQGKIESQRGELERYEARIREAQRVIEDYESKEGVGLFTHVNLAAVEEGKTKLERARKKLSELKEAVFDLEVRVSDAEEEKRQMERRLERLDALKNRLLREITTPQNTRSYHQIELSEEEVKSLKKRREDMKKMSFKEIMEPFD